MNTKRIRSIISTLILLLILVSAIIGSNYRDSRLQAAMAPTEILTTTEKLTTTTTTEPETTTTTTTTTTKPSTTTTTKPSTTTTTSPHSNPTKEVTLTTSEGTVKFRITCYTPYSDGGVWGYQTSTGVRSTHLKTCAVDPRVIPLYSTILVNGLELQAVDVGGAVKGNKIDIFYDGTSAEARAWLDSFGEYHTVTIL